MIRAECIDGHWRVVDDFGCRYFPVSESSDGATNGVFATRDFAADRWDHGTRFDEHAALLLAGVLRKLHELQDKLAMRIVLTCDPCNKKIREQR